MIHRYDQMIPALADLVPRDLLEIQAQLKEMGAVKGLEFVRVGTRGADMTYYKVKTDKGEMECRISLASDGSHLAEACGVYSALGCLRQP